MASQDIHHSLQVVDEEATQKKREEAIEAAKSKGEDETQVQVEDVKKSKSSTEWDWQIQNNLKPIWARSPKEVPVSWSLLAVQSKPRHSWQLV